VELQMIVFRHNLEEVPEFLAFARRVGVEAARLKTAQVLTPDPETIATWIPPETSRYAQPPQYLPNACWRLWRSTEITWDGQVLPCCFDKQADYAFGQLGPETSFAELWHNENAHAFRKQVFANRASIDICTNCSEGVRVWL
jgi:radical SAM protein with 4Fe4S-binding SPASM domain